jgi:hypothetical protein
MKNSLIKFRSKQYGQAMVEMVVIGGVMISIFLGIWYLGKFHDIQYSTIQAARYTAWERTAHSATFTDTTLQAQTRARLFMWDRNAYKSSDGKPNGSSWGGQNAQWGDHGDKAAFQRLVDKPDDVVIGTTSGAVPSSLAATFDRLLKTVTDVIGAITSGEPLNQGGLVTGTVKVKIANVGILAAPLNNLNLNLSEKSVLLTDSWDASGARQTAMRTRSFAPAAALASADAVLAPLKTVLSWLEPSFANFNPGQICPDVVPTDRVNGGNLPVYAGGGACF